MYKYYTYFILYISQSAILLCFIFPLGDGTQSWRIPRNDKASFFCWPRDWIHGGNSQTLSKETFVNHFITCTKGKWIHIQILNFCKETFNFNLSVFKLVPVLWHSFSSDTANSRKGENIRPVWQLRHLICLRSKECILQIYEK